ncbi:MAG: hypothetical protein K9K66_10485 [Desulfarculaceae bacterium]|nr:hypothetical protein [Desulfarculaceae bacterium]MCF8074087.1 hypothetical protein [Desulfarculaceae bacterium]MCF8102075.1 hypothetical protein [Desulfarculaceae bacterium]MCF8118113.1 hypothetical protein [Desulfarculaceae bacterium]
MKRFASLTALLLSLGLLLAVAPAWARPDVSGVWRGTWTCTKQPCPKTTGHIFADMQQDDTGHLKGTYTVDGSSKGSLRCTMATGIVSSDDQFGTTLKCGSYSIGMMGKVVGDTIVGEYDGTPVGMSIGNFTLSR